MDEVEKYQAAYKAASDASRDVTAMIRSIKKASQDLDYWRSCVIKDDAIRAATGTQEIDLSNWPSAPQLRDAIANWHRTRALVDQAWSEIPSGAGTALRLPR